MFKPFLTFKPAEQPNELLAQFADSPEAEQYPHNIHLDFDGSKVVDDFENLADDYIFTQNAVYVNGERIVIELSLATLKAAIELFNSGKVKLNDKILLSDVLQPKEPVYESDKEPKKKSKKEDK